MVLGEQSGGGACCIRMSSSADGFVFCSSYSGFVMCTGTMGDLDGGCPVDAYLVQEGEEPYALFYDLSVLSNAMNEFFDGAGAAD